MKKIKNSYDSDAHVWHRCARQDPGHICLEKPAMYNFVEPVAGKKILCLGCGYGEECSELQDRGAASVVGIDSSSVSVFDAQKNYPSIEFHEMDMEELDFEEGRFDIVFSSLAIHYLSNWEQCLKEMMRVSSPDATIVLSTHHPASWGAEKFENETTKQQLLGYRIDKKSGDIEFYGDYLTSRMVENKLFGKFEINYYHKTFSEMLNNFRDVGLEVLDCIEPMPIGSAKEQDPSFYQIKSKFPLFICFKLGKR